MKSLVVAALTIFMTLAVSAQTMHVKFSQSGSFASVSGSTDPNSSFSLNVSMNSSTTTGTNTSISFFTISVSPDGTSETFSIVQGSIPDADFTGQNTNNLAVNVDLSTLDPTAAFSETCTLDLITFNETCTPLTTGLIQVSFQENDAQRTQILDLNEVITVGPSTTRIHQSSDNGSANAQGTILGTPISSTSATVGVNKNASLESITTQ